MPGFADSGHDISLQWSGWSFSTLPQYPPTPLTTPQLPHPIPRSRKPPLAFRAKLGEQMERRSEKAIGK